MHVILTTTATSDFSQLITFYQSRAVHLGEDLVREVEEVLERIGNFPDAGAPYYVRTRRITLQRFPLAVIYRVRGEIVEVVAIAHQRRDPSYWTARERASSYGSTNGHGRPLSSRAA